MSISPVRDSYLSSRSNHTNYGSSATLRMGRTSGDVFRPILYFDLSPIPPGATITSAKLQLYATSAPSSPEGAALRRITQFWDESQVTWVSRTLVTNWSTPGGTTDPSGTVIWSFPTSTGSFDITGLKDLVVDGIENRSNQLDILLFQLFFQFEIYVDFNIKSSEGPIVFPQAPPELIVEYIPSGTWNENTTLYLGGHGAITNSGTLVVDGYDIDSDDTSLFTHGSISDTTSGNLFIGGSILASGAFAPTLFIHGYDVASDSSVLFINGHDAKEGSGTLFINGAETTQASGDLFLAGLDTESLSETLFIGGFVRTTDDRPLFLHGYDIVLNSGSLFIGGQDTKETSGDLFIKGGSIETSGALVPLFIPGHDITPTSGDLLINGHLPSTASRTLFIDAHAPLLSSGNLFIPGLDTSALSEDLYIQGHLSNDFSSTLFTIGLASISDQSDLFIRGHATVLSSSSLFIAGHVSLNDSVTLYMSGSGIIPISGTTTLIINGVVEIEPVSCPILDPIASIQIPDKIIALYQSNIDALINQLGKNTVLNLPSERALCPNCEQEIQGKRSVGVYKIGGPRPFARGRKCPYCYGEGFLETPVQKCIKCLVKWNPRDYENYGISVQDNDAIVRLKTYLTHMGDLLRAETAIIEHDQIGVTQLRVRRIREAIPIGLREDRYCISFWELI